MGDPSVCWALAWALLALLWVQKAEAQGSVEPSGGAAEAAKDSRRMDTARHMIFVPPIAVLPTMSPSNLAHNGRVCSTWGDFHYKTFDGDIFRFPGLCNYVFSAHCGAAYEDFNVQLRRGLAGFRPTITHVVLKTQGLVLEISNGSVLIDGQREKLPYSRASLLVEQSSHYVKVTVRLVLTFMWNGEDSALLELNPKYANQTCGLCGDFNGLPAVNEFYAHNVRLTPLQFGNLQKLDGPTEQCQDPQPSPADNCTDGEGICRRTLLGPAFAQCSHLVDTAAYVAACAQDLCRCPTCPCATFAEYSRQCAHAGGQPQDWRGPGLCPRTCPLNMQHQECGSPCADTCSNPGSSQLCEDHCMDGCFCPPGMVLDDVAHTGCLPLERCPCTHSGRTYAPGASFTTSCSSCTCSGGLWQCQDLPCPGTCSVQGGAHISTYDEKLYNMHGDCSYVLSKKCADHSFTVLAELRKCGLTDNENCLKTVTLSVAGGDTTIWIEANGGVFMNSIYTQLPVSAANITMFRPSTFFILVQTGFGLQLEVQLVPLMQVILRLDPAYRGQMCGLCGNFNQNQADDFRTLSGVVEGTAAAFANTWKTQATCPNVKNSFEDPCSLSVENENYAQHWCALLTDPAGSFSPCHSLVNPAPFYLNCLFDTCNCEKSEDCLCAALSSYVRACAARGVLLSGWRAGVCTKYKSLCPKSQSYRYVVDGCQPTCRALSQEDVTCGVTFVPVDGCTCPRGTFLDDTGNCVPAEACPCYFQGSVVAPGEVVHDNDVVCSCASGKLSCLGAAKQTSSGCVAPMVYLNCSNASAGTPGVECLRSCHTLGVECFSVHCLSGCVCPPGLVSNGSGGCVAEEDCPCLHNDAAYRPGDTIRVDCNDCTCQDHKWQCSQRPCLGTCVAYGDGHFITFDGKRYSFEGSCEYTLAQDHCGGNSTSSGTFRIVTENVPCGTTGVTCSKAIKIFLENYELILHEGAYKVVQRGPGADPPYKVRYMGTHLAIETRSGLVVSWDRKTSVFIRLHQDYKGRVCGLCGNFDDNAINDFTTRSQSVVGDALEFGNSWKFSPTCPDAPAPRDPCTANPYRKSWAQKQCSLINSPTFQACRSQVDSTKYYEACVSDACACDSGGDCECFCTAVAAYAQACLDVGVCVSWRTPDVCPLFCDYYNPQEECQWHYQPCGVPCLKTCRNPSGRCLMELPGQEGCYPKCPPSKPFFDEDQMRCVAQCGCYDDDGNYHDVGTKVSTAENCQSCECAPGGLQCTHSLAACKCTYEGRTYGYGDVIYNTTDGLGACFMALCGDNGTITRRAWECPGTPPTTPFTFTSAETPSSTTGPVPTFTVCVRELCRWSAWYDSSSPEPGMGGGDFETFANLRLTGHQVCPAPAQIECRAQLLPDTPLEQLGQNVDCDPVWGLRCLNNQQSPPLCHNYELRVLCCDYVPCSTNSSPATNQKPTPGPLPTSTTQATPAFTSQMTETQTASSSEAPGTICQPRCQWTEWFDEDYPKSEEAGGDIESYDKIRSAGGAVCEQPRDIECRAENFPDKRPEELGQWVHCDPSFGLVCRNDEQMGMFKMCYNYRIRLLCCSHDHCGEHTATTATTKTATATPTATAAATTAISTPTTTTATTTTATTPTATATPTTTTAATTITTATTMIPSATRTWTQLGSSPRVTQAPPGSTTAVPFRTVGPVFPATSPSPSQIDTLMTSATRRPTSPPGSTKPTALQATTGGTSQEHRPESEAIRASTARPGTLSSPVTTSTSPLPTPHTGESKRTVETPRATTEATTSQGNTGCKPKCEWTEWFDVDFPSSGVTGGDMETYDNIRAAGGKLCQAPQKVECRAESYPEVSLDQIGQVVSCSLQDGLVCRNQDQKGPFNMCFNYNIRVLCCSHTSHCLTSTMPVPLPSTQTLPAPSTPTSSKTLLTSLRTTQRTSVLNPSASPLVSSPVQTNPGIPSTSPTFGTTLSSRPWKPSSVSPIPTSPNSEVCEPQCAWTDWLDQSYPMPGASGGDFETYANIRAAGGAVCEQPVALECRAQTQPDVPLEQLGQTVLCRLEEGLVCRNRDQGGLFKMCLNYEIRVLCCDYRHCPSTPETSTPPTRASTDHRSPRTTRVWTTTTTQPLSSSARTIESVPTPTAETGPSTLRTTESVPTPTAETGPSTLRTTESVSTPTAETGPSTLRTTESVPTPTTETGPSTLRTTESVPTPTAETGPSTLRTTESVPTPTAETGPATPMTTKRVPETHTPPVSPLRPIPETTSSMRGSTLGLSTTAPKVTSTPTQAETSPTLITSPIITSATTTACQPRCAWTDWLDQSYPMPGASGGDFETYANIRAAGGAVCEQPVALECRAQTQPDVPLEQLGQTVLCRLEEGLVCRNRDQGGLFKMCLNYEIRVLCCDYRHCPSTPETSTPPTRASTDHRSPRTTRVWTTTTTQPLSSSARTIESVPTPTAETGPSTLRTTESVPTPTAETGPSTLRTTESVSTPTAETGPSTLRTTESVPTPTTETGPSTLRTTESVPTPTAETGPSTLRTTESVPTPTAETGPATPMTTKRVPETHTPPVSPLRPIPETTSSMRGSTLGLSTTAPKVTSTPTQAETSPTLITSPIITSATTTACQPRCAWTDWLDQSYPMPGASGGDFETYANIRAAGGAVCEQPVALECRAQTQPDVPLEQLGQTVLCRLEEGLVCRNRDQGGLFKMCLNYQIRMLCCDDSHCPSTPETSTPPTRASTDHRSTRTTGVWTTTTTQPLPSSATTTESVPTPTAETGPSTLRTTESVPTPTAETGPSTPMTTKRVPETHTPPVSPLRPIPETTSSMRGSTLGLSTTAPKVTSTPTQAETSPTLITSPIITSATTTACQPRCAWTDWLDQSYPMPGASGGDFETYANIRAAGGAVCEQPVALECRAQTQPDVPLEQLGQTVLCRLEEGLVCRNRDQGGLFKMCLNYQIRVLCCDDRHCPSTPETSTPPTRASTDHRSTRTTGVWTTTTTQPLPSSATTTESVPTPTAETGPSTLKTTEIVPTPTAETGPSTLRTTERVPTPTAETGPSTLRTTESVPTPTAETGPSTLKTTESVPTPTAETGPSTLRTTESVPTPTTETGPSTLRTTESVPTPTAETGPSTLRTTESVPTPTAETGPSTLRTTESVPTPTAETGPSTLRTTESVPTPTAETGPSTLRTTESVPTPTAETGPSTLKTTESVPTPTAETGPSTLRTTESVPTPTAETGPSTLKTTESVPTPTAETGPSTLRTTESVPTPTTETGPSTLRTTESVSTPTVETGPSTLKTTESVSTPTAETGPSTLRTTESVPTPTAETGPSTPMTTKRVPETHTPPVSPLRPIPETTSSVRGSTLGLSTTAPKVTSTPTQAETSPTLITSPIITSATTTACQPRCAWTDWLDQSYPMPGAFGGDFETYANIRAAGGAVCEQPVALECRAQTQPDVPLEQLGQTVLCRLEEGLVCRNRDQGGLFKMCLNYQIRVLCCDNRHCPSTPETSTPPTRASTDHRSTRTTGVWTMTTTQPLPSSATTTESVPHTAPLVTRPVQPSSGIPSTSPTSTTSTVCQPQCTWTDWFDEDYPTPVPDGGDFETFSVLRAAGHVFCEQPQDIQCRSEREPGLSLQEVGQVVLCSVHSGLVCRNRDQPGPVPYCHNFHVRLLCCDTRCAATPSTPPPSASTPHGPSAAPSPPSPTTPCRCQAFGQLFSPGDVVYNRTDGAGCRFYAICNQHCELDRVQGACPTPAPPEPSTSVPPTSPAPGCDLTNPPRQVNESWTLEDCTVARCEGDNRIVLLPPKPTPQVTCVNGHQPVRVQSPQEPCQQHYECECSCSGWGGSHYITFDGTPYSFWGNCTYVLVREARPRHGNLTVLLHNHYCEAAPASVPCPRALSLHYESVEVVLTTTTTAGGQEESLILFDGVRLSQGFSKNGVSVSTAGSSGMRVSIPAIGVSVAFDGHVFQIQLPYGHFSNNTEGQCGTCTNSKTDDCRRPDGTTAPTCHDMAPTWLVPESGKEDCPGIGPPTPSSSPSWVPTTPTSAPCPPAPVCKLILSPFFATCHSLIPPGLFFSTCVSTACQAGRPEAPCESLEAYAALCRVRGVCSDWRNATDGLCDLTCPPGKVYKPCGPTQPLSCDIRSQSWESQGLAEGCYCPDGQTLFNTHTDVCVPQCTCVGPDGFPKFPGERWVSNCQACVCDEGTTSVQCVPVQCEARDPPLECSQAGFTTVTRPRADNPCCQETLCVCNVTTCPQNPPKCGPGEVLVRIQEDSCCPTFICWPKLCTYNGAAYGVGATFPGVVPCHMCTCRSVDAQSATVQCEETTCNTTCAQGSEYSTVAGQCCGECVQTDCLTPDGQLVQPNETWVDGLADNCTEYRCQIGGGVPVLVPNPAPCQDVSSCRGVLRKTGCCYSCEEEDSCQVRVNRTVLRHQGCEAPANLTFCEGACPGESKYSAEAQALQRRCTCCQETKAHEEVVTLRCPDGTAVQHTYTHIDDCRCALSCVSPPAAPGDSTHVLPS